MTEITSLKTTKKAHKKSRKYRFIVWGIAIAMLTALCDQYSKWFMVDSLFQMSLSESNSFVEWFSVLAVKGSVFERVFVTPMLDWVLVWNRGVSFGLFGQAGDLVPYLLSGLASCVALGFLIWLFWAERFMQALAAGLIAGGAFGNVFDRLRFGAVIDFIDVHYQDIHWPAFNVADICINLGALILIIDMIRQDRKDKLDGSK